MASKTSKFFDFILPKKKTKAGGVSVTNTYESGNTEVLSLPDYNEHLNDLKDLRLDENSLDIIQELMRTDPDVSATTNAYLTVADTNLHCLVYNRDGELDREGLKVLQNFQYKLFSQTDYTLGFQAKDSLHSALEKIRYMLLMRGSVGVELVYDKAMQPSSLRIVDGATIRFRETKAGEYKPVQETDNEDEINLDIATFFYTSFRQDPTSPYSYSFFTACINTIAARQQIINDLYRIMRYTGFPRIKIEILEEVIRKYAPKDVADDPKKLNDYVRNSLQTVVNSFSNVRADQPIGHTDSMKVEIMNDKGSGAGLQVSEIIETLNAQNQSALKVVATLIGRGSSGVNTSSVESRIFSMSTDSFNKSIADMLSKLFTLGIRIDGFDGFVRCEFEKVEMRPDLELEAQKTMKQARLLEQLSLGIITDDYFNIQMNGELGSDSAPILSGTGFNSTKIDTSTVSPNSDPLGRSLTTEDAESARSNGVKKQGDVKNS